MRCFREEKKTSLDQAKPQPQTNSPCPFDEAHLDNKSCNRLKLPRESKHLLPHAVPTQKNRGTQGITLTLER